MPASSSRPPRSGDSPRDRACYANPAMRVSDAERAEVADRLSQHFGDGRLDQEEFDRRLHQAMSAVTQADLAGLFADLPDVDAAAGPAAGGPRPGSTPADGAVPPGQTGSVPPDGGADAGVASRPRPRRPRQVSGAIGIALIIVIAAAAGHALAQLFFPWILVAVLAFAWLRHESGRRHRRSSGR
jgi:Domain of unknown function (DUF1707)